MERAGGDVYSRHDKADERAMMKHVGEYTQVQ